MTDEPETTDLTGQRIGNYQIIELLGKGSMGEVYLARHPVLNREVAVKVLPQELSLGSEAEARFRREAKAESQVQHPSIVEVYDFGTLEDGRMYYVMERLKGATLAEHLEEHKRLSLEETLTIIGPVMGGLAKAHKAGVIHRDLKPDNILLLAGHSQDFVKILDFGIAKVPSAVGHVTQTIMGTPRYMPPEQIMQKDMDGRVDIFALGVILFECLSGQPPIQATTAMEYMVKNCSEPPRELGQILTDAPPRLSALLKKTMAKDPNDRPASMFDVLNDLRSVATEAGWLSTPQEIMDSVPGIPRPPESATHRTKPGPDPDSAPAPAPAPAAPPAKSTDHEMATDPTLAAPSAVSPTAGPPAAGDPATATTHSSSTGSVFPKQPTSSRTLKLGIGGAVLAGIAAVVVALVWMSGPSKKPAKKSSASGKPEPSMAGPQKAGPDAGAPQAKTPDAGQPARPDRAASRDAGAPRKVPAVRPARKPDEKPPRKRRRRRRRRRRKSDPFKPVD